MKRIASHGATEITELLAQNSDDPGNADVRLTLDPASRQGGPCRT